MENLHIRPMLKKDIAEISELEKEIFSIPWSEAGFHSSIDRSDTIFLSAVRTKGGLEEIAGYGGIYCVLDEAELVNIAVKEKYRGKKVGKLILEQLVEQAFCKGVRSIWLEVRESNAAAALYRRSGFEVKGKRKNFYDKPEEDAIVMLREISTIELCRFHV